MTNPVVWFVNSYGIFLVIVATLVHFAKANNIKFAIHLVAVILVTLFVSIISKEIFDRPRPYDAIGILGGAGLAIFPSFPSGHAAISFALATAVSLKEVRLGVFLFFLAVLFSFGRVVALVHYPTDIASGMLVGIVVALFFDKYRLAVVRKKKRKDS